MSNIQFASVPGGEKDVTIASTRVDKTTEHYVVSYKDKVLSEFDSGLLIGGTTVKLPDGRELCLFFRQSIASSRVLDMTLDGKPVEQAPGSIRNQLGYVYGFIFFIGGLNLVLGLVQVLTGNRFLFGIGLNIVSVGFGIIWIILGLFIMRKSLTALVIAMVLYIAMVLTNYIAAMGKGHTTAISLALPALIVLYMVRSITMLRSYKKTRTPETDENEE